MRQPESKTIYEMGYDPKKGWTITALANREDYWKEWDKYWAWKAKQRFHALPEEKGIPVPRTSSHRLHSKKDRGKSGVIGNSRVLPHRYMDEGDKGKVHNRHIKRLERAQWREEWHNEEIEEEEVYPASEWFCEEVEEEAENSETEEILS